MKPSGNFFHLVELVFVTYVKVIAFICVACIQIPVLLTNIADLGILISKGMNNAVILDW